ncbi:HlyD family efflux transporter periplasmic adaptor subunit [Rathayibacter sp. ZW T2_19]|uniref:HlyD family efflux transporter periplasmic adaptor subunit n=1 Tax=Rathayibacter rubneri TaxID=2950106 RepID=A0A9X2DYI4_9MICO|nr:HlyD family efflux transporter periplasmic adaptor subunit [Rathayibacter rubneri]MCM6763297.1 HlyD family efflux transporter periplasmic adaptor subunit [Rathayibacter rubneri]
MKPLRWLGFVLSCVVAVGIAAAGLVYANISSLTVRAASAQLVTEDYSLGTPFAGTIQDLTISRGDSVQKGDVLFSLQSAILESDMQTKDFTSADVGYTIEPGGLMVFTAALDGVVKQVDTEIGAFVEEDEILAVVAIADSIHLESEFSLGARDYSRIPVGGTVAVAMPDGTTVDAEIYDIEVEQYRNGRATTVVRARTDEITTQDYNVVGAPVRAELRLQDDESFGGWLVARLGDLVTPGGFAR